jgi:hypothetical protein
MWKVCFASFVIPTAVAVALALPEILIYALTGAAVTAPPP